MSVRLADINSENFQKFCFSPTGKRAHVCFEPHFANHELEGTGLNPQDYNWYSQLYSSNSMQDGNVAILKLSKNSPTQNQKEYYADRNRVLEDKKEAIVEHVSRRIALFFQQAIVCYSTPFHFSAEGAEDQYGGGSTVKLSSTVTHRTEAAHSSTFPCLYASPINDQGVVDDASAFVFLKHAHSYTQHNGTCELPREVNTTDTYLDGKTNERKLRGLALDIINETARGDRNPTEATKEFLRVFEGRLVEAIGHLKADDLRRKVAKMYLTHVREVQTATAASDEIFDHIMGVKLPGEEGGLRDVVYKKRYTLIREAEFLESQIALRLLAAQNAMLKNEAKSLPKLDVRLRYTLLKGAQNESERLFLEKLFCCSLAGLLATLAKDPAKLKRLDASICSFNKTHAKELDVLRRDLRLLRSRMVRLEFEFRSSLFKGIRVDHKGWTQNAFATQFIAQFPVEPMSRSMVSRLEQPSRTPTDRSYRTPLSQRQKLMTVAKAQMIADTYGLDVGIFLPCLIAS